MALVRLLLRLSHTIKFSHHVYHRLLFLLSLLDFGIELGFVKANYLFVKRFPYNLIPHPMILGQVFALVGLFKSPHLHSFDLASGGGIATRWSPIGLLPGAGSGLDGWWWLVPIHVVCLSLCLSVYFSCSISSSSFIISSLSISNT
jgi:hypothetical protein